MIKLYLTTQIVPMALKRARYCLREEIHLYENATMQRWW